jgi:FkbM family methyltransferase
MQKLQIYIRYLFEYLRFGDFISIYASINYLLRKKSHKKDRIIHTSIGKFYCRKHTNDFQFANLMYEWSVKEFLFQSIGEYSVFIDGGACIGDYCILLSKYNIRSIAFEPVPSNFKALQKNFELNGLNGKAKAFQLGLGDINGQAQFIFNPVNTGASGINRRNKPGGIEVEICTLDSMIDKMNISEEDRILVKLDAESMEPEALRGAKDFIQKYPEITLIIEDKFTGKNILKSTLDSYAKFEYGVVDKYNMFARKTGNLN